MKKSLIYAAYDYYESDTQPIWVGGLKETLPEVLVYDPSKSLGAHVEFDEETITSLTCKASPEILQLLKLPPEISASIADEKVNAALFDAERSAKLGYVDSILAVNHYMLVRSSLVIVDGDSAFGSGPSVDLVLSTQLGIPTILVCNRTIQPPWMLAYADVSVMTGKLVKLVATILKGQGVVLGGSPNLEETILEETSGEDSQIPEEEDTPTDS